LSASTQQLRYPSQSSSLLSPTVSTALGLTSAWLSSQSVDVVLSPGSVQSMSPDQVDAEPPKVSPSASWWHSSVPSQSESMPSAGHSNPVGEMDPSESSQSVALVE
jgi:hypothetical protein